MMYNNTYYKISVTYTPYCITSTCMYDTQIYSRV